MAKVHPTPAEIRSTVEALYEALENAHIMGKATPMEWRGQRDALEAGRALLSALPSEQRPYSVVWCGCGDGAICGNCAAQCTDSVHPASGDLLPLDTVRTSDERWQPIATAPQDGSLVMLGASNGVWVGKYKPVYVSGYRPSNPWASMLLNHDHMAERYTRPTHWMPLPPSPQLGAVSVPPEVAGQRPSQDHPESCGSTQPAAVPATQEQQWCCIAGKAMDVNVCWECAQASAGYSAAMADAPAPAAVPAYQPMTDEEVDRALSVVVPGGSQARDWFLPHETERGLANVRNVVRLMVSAVLARVAAAPAAAPVAWRVRGYAAFKTGEPGPWRYVDGPARPKVNNPECCDFEPLYLAAPAAVQPVAQQQPTVHQVAGSGLPLDTVRTGGEVAQSKPVAYLCTQGQARALSFHAVAGVRCQPLYATAPAPQLGAVSVPAETASGANGQDQPKRPLTRHELHLALDFAGIAGDCTFDKEIAIARVVERAHGITGGSSNE